MVLGILLNKDTNPACAHPTGNKMPGNDVIMIIRWRISDAQWIIVRGLCCANYRVQPIVLPNLLWFFLSQSFLSYNSFLTLPITFYHLPFSSLQNNKKLFYISKQTNKQINNILFIQQKLSNWIGRRKKNKKKVWWEKQVEQFGWNLWLWFDTGAVLHRVQKMFILRRAKLTVQRRM